MRYKQDYPVLTARPYQFGCIVCSLGQEDAAPTDARIAELLGAIRNKPDAPVALRCNAGDEFSYQDPGAEDDTPQGAEFNRKRDMDILQRLDLPPGAILPARIILGLFFEAIPSVAGICGYDTVTADAWRGCPRASTGCYEKGHAKGMDAIIPPRSKEQMKQDKQDSLAAMYQAEAIKIRPHILLCAVALYGGGTRPPFEPDNLPEMIQHIIENPDVPITLVSGADWMMCAPCHRRVPDLNACVCGTIYSGGLYNEMKDLNVLQALGLTYGTTMTARELYNLIFERIPSTAGICALGNNASELSVWRDACAKDSPPCPAYEKGREMLMTELAEA